MMSCLEVFFIFLVFAKPTGGVDVLTLKLPYYDGDECVAAAERVYDRLDPKYPTFRGALCWTIDEAYSEPYQPERLTRSAR